MISAHITWSRGDGPGSYLVIHIAGKLYLERWTVVLDSVCVVLAIGLSGTWSSIVIVSLCIVLIIWVAGSSEGFAFILLPSTNCVLHGHKRNA